MIYYYTMGIYGSGDILGIQMYNFNDDDLANVLFEKKYNKIMSDDEKKHAYMVYTELNNKQELVHFKYYTECSSTYGEGTFLMWCPMSLDLFLEKIGV